MNTQTQLPTHTTQEPKSTPIRSQRAAAVALSTVTAAATWAVATTALDIDVAAPSFDTASPAMQLGIGSVIASTAIATLLGWALLATLERATARAMAMWTAAAAGFALVSLAGPLSGTGVSTSQRLVLVLLHVVVPAVFIPLMRRSTHQ